MLRKDFREILSVELISITGGLVAGVLLALVTKKFELIAGLFIILPGFLEMRGNISGTLSGRLSSGLFVGAIKPRLKRGKILNGNIKASIFLGLAISLALGVFAYIISGYVFGIADPRIILIAVVAGVISNIIEIPATVATTFWLFKKGHDPNNVMGPYVTTLGDIISIISLMIAVIII